MFGEQAFDEFYSKFFDEFTIADVAPSFFGGSPPSPTKQSHPLYVAEAFLTSPYRISPHNFTYTVQVSKSFNILHTI